MNPILETMQDFIRNPGDAALNGANARRAGRLLVEGLACDRGCIIDLSVRGMRLRSRRAWTVGQRRDITLSSARTRLVLPARCVWARRDGLFSWTIGLAFDAANPQQLQVAGELALIHAARLDSTRRAA
jgi:hypothetical protein